ncbi:hypothetical protein [Nocardia testacea]|uniref:hypothetical protein n=1 Tax=Nocardia testacea TaxID=248551 RepID=UPI003A893AA7
MWCPTCEKRRYITRRDARRVARTLPGNHISTYECEELPGWHIGHLPNRVRWGEVTRDEHFASKRVIGLHYVDVA